MHIGLSVNHLARGDRNVSWLVGPKILAAAHVRSTSV